MKTIKKEEVKYEFVNEIKHSNLEPNTFYICLEKMHSSHLCLGGCKYPDSDENTLIVLPIKCLIDFNNETKENNYNCKNNGWEFFLEEDHKLTIKPSILNHPCDHHYIVTKGIANLV